MCEKIDDSGVIQGEITCMARPKAEHSLLWAGTSPPRCLQRVYVGLRSLCIALCHFVLVYVQFVLVYVGLCWFGQTGTQTDSKEQDPSFLTTVLWGGVTLHLKMQ